jgi:hypothetical protein
MSASAYIHRVKVSTIAKASKVQYNNHVVSVDNISNGVIPCIPNLNQIVYGLKPKCPCNPPVSISIFDGGSPGDNYPGLDGGYPSSSGRVIDCGTIQINFFDGGSPGDNFPGLDGGYPGSSGGVIDCGTI